MWGASFLFLFTLKLFVAVGNTYPTTGSEPVRDNIMAISDATASVTPYTCVYIPPNLDLCKFASYTSTENLWDPERKPENKKRKLLESNKIYFTSRPSMRVPGTKKFQSQPFVKTIIYEIQRCAPTRLPFVLPWCTDEDLSNKKNEIRRLYPFVTDDFSKTIPNEFPTYDLFKQTRMVSKSL